MPIHAEISLTGTEGIPLGAQRVALLEAIGREGSISGAARAVGLSYRAAWDAIRAMNNLVGRPLVAGQTGGRRGGGASLTPEGIALVRNFRRLETEMARAFNALAPELDSELGGNDATGGATAARLMFGGFLRTSARNELRGTIVAAHAGPVSAEVALEIAEGQVLVTTLTSRSLRDLGLFPGRPAIALVKAPLIGLAAPGTAAVARNQIEGIVETIERDARGTEVLLGIGAGKSLCAALPDDAPAFAPGGPARALIDPAHIILAVE